MSGNGGFGVALRAGLLLLGCGLAWGCASPANAVGLATSEATREPGSRADAQSAAASLDGFGFDLYRPVAAGKGNLVFSPASIYVALSMAGAGARGETAAQMEKVLHQAAGAASGNGVNSLDQALARLNATFTDPDGTKHEVRLHVANAPFAQSGMHFEKAYLDTLASGYGAGLRLVDFKSDSAGATRLINDWVSEQTEKRIPTLLDSLDPLTRLVLVNAIYLKAPWQVPFEPDQTADASFTLPDRSTVKVPTMHASIKADYAEGAGWQAVELPYMGGSLAMTIIVPTDLASFESRLDGSKFAAIVSALGAAEVQLSLPRFGAETRADLVPALSGLGMPLAMDAGRADFSGITTDEALYIGAVVHQANITVDEKGTEAAAATAVVMVAAATPNVPKVVTLNVDRPFIFALRDTSSGAILFLGRIVDPSASA